MYSASPPLIRCVHNQQPSEPRRHRPHRSADASSNSTRHRASPVYADGKIYVTARDGTFSVVKAGPKFELLAQNRLPDTFTASPVISGGRIYLRGFKALYAIGNSEQ